MKRHEAQSVAQIIREAMAAAGATVTYDRQRACFLWPEVVGPTINRFTSRRWVDDAGVLHVAITSPALRSDLAMNRQTLVDRLNQAAGTQAITDLRLHAM